MRAIMNISLTEELRRYVLGEVERGAFGSASEYFRELVRQDRKNQLSIRNREKAHRRWKIEREHRLLSKYTTGMKCGCGRRDLSMSNGCPVCLTPPPQPL